jgi:Tol biopolymer transport system component
MTHPSVDTVAELVCRRLDAEAARAVEEHIADCDACRELVAVLARSSLVRFPSGAPTPLAGGDTLGPVPVLLRRGDRVGRFEIRECIGAGGMGIVYAAHDTELDRTVAVKVLRPELAVGAEARTLLLAEAQALARLVHPNVITVYEVGTVGDQVFVAMERLRHTLRTWLATPRSVADIVRVLAAAGRGLAAAHAAHLVHRDVKPENVLIDDDGRVCVSDFGLAIAAGADDAALVGTPAYMAPEQRAGSAADAAADQYSFCVVLKEALGDRRVPGWLERALARGLAAEPAARFPSMAALIAELERDRSPRRRIAAIVAASLVAESVVLLAGVRYLAHSGSTWRPEVVDLEAFEENADDPAISPDGTRLAYVSDRGHTGRFVVYIAPLRAGRGGAHRAVSDPAGNCYPAHWSGDGRTLVMGCQVTGEPHVIERASDSDDVRDLGPGVPYDVCGDRILVATRSGRELVLRDPASLRDVSLLRIPDADRFRRARCTADGSRIVYAQIPGGAFRFVSDIFVIDRQRTITRLSSPRAPAVSPEVTSLGAFTPDGGSVVLSLTRNHKTNLYEVPLAGGEPRQLTFGDGPDLGPDVSRDGKIVVYDRDTTSGPLFVTDEHGSTQLTQRLEFFTRIRPATAALLVAERLDADGMQVVAVDIATGEARTLAAGRLPIVTSDGARVGFTPLDDPSAIHQVALAGGSAAPFAKLPGKIVEGTSARDGMHVLIDHDGTLEGWRVASDGRSAAEGVPGLVIPAPDGRWRAIAARDERGNVRVTFVPPGTPLAITGEALTARSFSVRWVDATRFGYCDLTVSCRVMDVTTHADVRVTKLGPGYLHAIAGLDGGRWFSHGIRGRVTRHLITNFATRH